MTIDELCDKSRSLIKASKTPMTVAAAVSDAIKDIPNAELIDFLKRECYYDIRYYLEEQIIGAVVNKIRYQDSKNRK